MNTEITQEQIENWKRSTGKYSVGEDSQSIRMLDAQLRFYMHIDPDLLTDREWAMRVRELQWLLEKEAQAAKS